MDGDSQSLTSDPGLFDEEIIGGSVASSLSGSESSNTAFGNNNKRSHESARRSYNPVSAEAKKSSDYAIHRQRNNFAVKRCRTITKSKLKGLEIKTAGYQYLMREYEHESKEIEAKCKNLELLFRQHIIESSNANSQSVSTSRFRLQEAIDEEDISRRLFDAKLLSVRQHFVDQLQEANVADTSSSSRLSSNNSSDCSLLRFNQPDINPP